MKNEVCLSDNIEKTENLSRIICAGSKRKTQKRYFNYDEDDGRYNVEPVVFMDSRNPIELSVNRISTLTEEASHKLGLQHKEDTGMPASYSGFAKIQANRCYNNACKILKDDYNGLKPYHANIVYPHFEKEKNQLIAAELAYYADLILYFPRAC